MFEYGSDFYKVLCKTIPGKIAAQHSFVIELVSIRLPMNPDWLLPTKVCELIEMGSVAYGWPNNIF